MIIHKAFKSLVARNKLLQSQLDRGDAFNLARIERLERALEVIVRNCGARHAHGRQYAVAIAEEALRVVPSEPSKI